MNTVLVFLLVGVPAVLCVGGMAELKSITGDEQYNGPANAPAVLPQPQGFWGRPRYYSPMGSWNTMTPFGGNGWVGGDGSRFSSSFSSGPYGTNHRFSPIPTTDSQFGSSSGAGGFGSPLSSGMGSGMGSAIDSSESMNRENLMLGALTVLGSLFNTDPSSVNTGDLSQPSMPSPSSSGLPSSFTIPRGAPGPSGTLSGSQSGAPLSSATGGGFFTGRGNDFVNKA